MVMTINYYVVLTLINLRSLFPVSENQPVRICPSRPGDVWK